MAFKLFLLDDAIEDIQNSSRYYNRKQQGLGRRFEIEVNQAFSKIKNLPLSTSFAYDTVRYKVMDKFPFIILYEISDTKVIVLRVFNTHQDTATP